MKKLMTMIAAVGMAFGLFADTFTNSVDFAGYSNVNPWLLTQKDGETPDTLWAWAGTAAAPVSNETAIADGELVLATGSNVLSRKFAAEAQEIGDGLFVDMEIDYNGEALDTVPTVTAGGGKIAIFALDTTTEEGAPAETNVYVLANYGTDGKALYKIKTFDFATPRRVALKTYANVIQSGSDPRAGFLVYMGPAESSVTELLPATVTAVYAFDANDKVVWTDVKGDNYLGRTDVVSSKWVTGKNLFVSLDSDPNTRGKLAAVDFTGRAKLASITLTDDDGSLWPADDVRLPVTLTDATISNVTNARYEGGYLIADDNDVQVTFEAAPDGKGNVTVTYAGAEVKPVNGVYTITFNENNALTVRGWDTGATVKIGDVTTAYETIGQAIGAANGAGAAATIALAKPVTDLTVALVFENAEFEITLDLAGRAITGAVDGELITNNGLLKITDSDVGGYIENTFTGGEYPVYSVANNNTLTVDEGIFKTAVLNAAGDQTFATANISGGKFDAAFENDEGCTLTITGGQFKGYEKTELEALIDTPTYRVVNGDEGYLKVELTPAPTTAKLTVTPAVNGTLSTDKEGDVNIGDTVTVTAIASDHYHLVKITTNDVALAQGETTFVMPAEDVTVAAEFAIDTFTVTFKVGTENYAVSNNVPYGTAFADVKPTDPPASEAHKTFTGWTPEGVEVTADATYTAVFGEVAKYVLTVNPGEGVVNVKVNDTAYTAPVTFYADDASLVVKVTADADTGYDNVKFAWGLTTDSSTCEFTIAADTTVSISATKKEDPLPDPINGGSEKQKEDYKKWAEDNNVTGNDAINAIAFALNADVKAAGGNVEAAIVTALDTAVALTADEVAKFSAEYKGEPFTIAGYPNAQFKFVQTDVIQSDTGRFFKLTAEFLSAND